MRIPLLPSWLRVALAVGVAAVVLAASVVPPPPGADQSLGPFGLLGADKWAHAGGYALLVAAVAYARLDRSRRQLIVAVAVAATFGLAVEGLQHGVPWRSFSLADAAANAVGALVGAAVWRRFRVGRRLEEVPSSGDARG